RGGRGAAGKGRGGGGGRAQAPLAGAGRARHVVVQRAALAQRHAGEVALGRLGRLADRLRHLARFAVAVTDPALLVADDDERREAKAPAALHHLGDTVDRDELLGELAVPFVPVPMLAWFTCHD